MARWLCVLLWPCNSKRAYLGCRFAPSSVLLGLQIRSLFGRVFDGVNPPGGLFSTTETLFLIGMRFANPTSGRIISTLIAAPSCGFHKSGTRMSLLVKDSIGQPPTNIDRKRLRQGLIAVGGDGQVVKGGPEAKHESTSACELLWESVHPNSAMVAAYWDIYHGGEACERRSLAHECAIEVLDIYKAMNALFGVGIGARSHRRPMSCHTRQGTNAFRNSEDLIRNYPLYHVGMRVRLEQSHVHPETGREAGSQNIKKPTTLCRRANSVDFVIFCSFAVFS